MNACLAGRLRLLYEANPVGFLIEQAGGRASTGRQPVLGVAPSSLHHPLFSERSLFRD